MGTVREGSAGTRAGVCIAWVVLAATAQPGVTMGAVRGGPARAIRPGRGCDWANGCGHGWAPCEHRLSQLRVCGHEGKRCSTESSKAKN